MAGNGAFSEWQVESFEAERRDRLGFQKHEHIPGQAENTVLFVHVAWTENDRLRKAPVGVSLILENGKLDAGITGAQQTGIQEEQPEKTAFFVQLQRNLRFWDVIGWQGNAGFDDPVQSLLKLGNACTFADFA